MAVTSTKALVTTLSASLAMLAPPARAADDMAEWANRHFEISTPVATPGVRGTGLRAQVLYASGAIGRYHWRVASVSPEGVSSDFRAGGQIEVVATAP